MEYKFKKMKEKDLLFFNKVRNKSKEWLHDNSEFTLKETENWFYKCNPEFYIVSFNNLPIGYFRTSNYDLFTRSIYIGMDLDPNYRGIGHAKASYPIFMKYLKRIIDIDKYYLRVLKKNIRAYSLYLKLGFKICEETEIDYKMELKDV